MMDEDFMTLDRIAQIFGLDKLAAGSESGTLCSDLQKLKIFEMEYRYIEYLLEDVLNQHDCLNGNERA